MRDRLALALLIAATGGSRWVADLPKRRRGAAMLSMLLEGIDWRMPAWTARPEVVG